MSGLSWQTQRLRSCLPLLIALTTGLSALCSPELCSAPLKLKDVRALKRALQTVERALSPQRVSARSYMRRALKSLSELEQIERLAARYLHESQAKQQRGAALSARGLLLNELREPEGLFTLRRGRLCLRAQHRANLAGVLLHRGAPREAIEQLKRGASCAEEPQSFWDAIYLIAEERSYKEIVRAVKPRVSSTLIAQGSQRARLRGGRQ